MIDNIHKNNRYIINVDDYRDMKRDNQERRNFFNQGNQIDNIKHQGKKLQNQDNHDYLNGRMQNVNELNTDNAGNYGNNFFKVRKSVPSLDGNYHESQLINSQKLRCLSSNYYQNDIGNNNLATIGR